MDDTVGGVVVEACDKVVGDPVQIMLPSSEGTARAHLPSFNDIMTNFPDDFLFDFEEPSRGTCTEVKCKAILKRVKSRVNPRQSNIR